MLLKTVFDEYINFYQPIVSIQVLSEENNRCYGNYKNALSIQFAGSDKIYYIVDNEQNRTALPENMYNIK